MNPAGHSQLAAALCPAKLTPEMEVASLWWWQSYRTAADQYYEGLQRTHTRVRELDGHDSCCVAGPFQQLYDSYHTSSRAATEQDHTKQATQQANHDDTQTLLMRLKLQRTAAAAAAAAAAAVAARAPSPQANEHRMAKEKTATYRKHGKK